MSIKSNGISISRERIDWLLSQPFEVKVSLIQNHLQICKILANSLMEEEVERYCGPRYSREKPHGGQFSRYGINPGSIHVDNQRIKVEVPRIRNNHVEPGHKDQFETLESYQSLHQIAPQDMETMLTVLHGISTRDYEKVVNTMKHSFGLSKSNVSRRFIEISAEQLKAFEKRNLGEYEFIALFIDGKSLLDQQMIIVLGVTKEGSKIPLGLVQSATENALPIENLLNELIERGLKVDEGILCVIDGSKGIKKALVTVFGKMAVIQRCQWHKRENILSYLAEEEKEIFKGKIQNAYQMEDYQNARNALEEIAKGLEKLNKTAANSLREGLEETLTLHRLGIRSQLRKSFSTTNCIESVNSQIKKYVGRITNWVNSDQRYRWTVAALLEAEVRMRKVNGNNHLKSLKLAIKKEVSTT